MDSIHCRMRRWDFLGPMYKTFIHNIPKNLNWQKKKNTYNDCFQVTSLLMHCVRIKTTGKSLQSRHIVDLKPHVQNRIISAWDRD